MSHFSEFVRSKKGTYTGIGFFMLFSGYIGLMAYQEKLEIESLIKMVMGELVFLIPLFYKKK